MSDRQWLVPLTGDQIRLLRSAIDSHLYETAGNNGWPVNSGYVLDPRLDRLASEGPLSDDEVEICEALDEHDKLDGVLRDFDVADEEDDDV
jgi:hypothetical protein